MTDMPGSFGANDPDIDMNDGSTYAPPAQLEINMNDGSTYAPPAQLETDMPDTTKIWAANEVGEDTSQRPVNPAKRVAVGNPARDTVLDLRQTVVMQEEKAKAERRQRKEAEAKLLEAQQQIEKLRQDQQNTGALWDQQQALWQGQWDMFQEQLNQTFQQQLEQQRSENFQQVREQLEAQMAEREAQLFKQLTDAEEHHRDLRVYQAEYETKMAAFHARFSYQKGAQHPQNDGIENLFPEAPPPRIPQFIPEATRAARQVEAVIRQGSDRFPIISMTAPTQPEPSPAPGTSETLEQNNSRASLVDFDDPVVQQRLKVLIRPLINEIGVKKPPRKAKKTKIGFKNSLTAARKEQQEQMTPDIDRRWKTITREMWRRTTSLNRAIDFFDYEGISEATSKRCEKGETAPEASTSKLYFGPGYTTSLWNKTILEKCIQEMLNKRDEDPNRYEVPDVSHGYLLALFHNYLSESRITWSRHQPRMGETFTEARRRAGEYDMERRGRNVGNSRKTNKYDARHKTADKMVKVCLAKKDLKGAEGWKWLRDDFLPELDVGGMSSEEDEPAELECAGQRMMTTGHSIKVCPWRVKKATGYVEKLDKAREKVLTKSRNLRMRVRSTKESMTEAPIGLPRTLYDADWLSNQKKFIPNIEEELMISEKELPLMEIEMVESN
ncbi:hypothetical protein B0H11DRAFT_1937640 [Mycena galericulata]|nr:hypothetical protein B0H11DRAFT_1937640 [Mycena galericulata]